MNLINILIELVGSKDIEVSFSIPDETVTFTFKNEIKVK